MLGVVQVFVLLEWVASLDGLVLIQVVEDVPSFEQTIQSSFSPMFINMDAFTILHYLDEDSHSEEVLSSFLVMLLDILLALLSFVYGHHG